MNKSYHQIDGPILGDVLKNGPEEETLQEKIENIVIVVLCLIAMFFYFVYFA